MSKVVERDERTIAVENSSYRLGYMVTAFSLLVAVMIRSYKLGDPSWDLLGIVVGSGLIVTVYQGRAGILGRSAAIRWVLSGLIGAGIALMMTLALFGKR